MNRKHSAAPGLRLTERLILCTPGCCVQLVSCKLACAGFIAHTLPASSSCNRNAKLPGQSAQLSAAHLDDDDCFLDNVVDLGLDQLQQHSNAALSSLVQVHSAAPNGADSLCQTEQHNKEAKTWAAALFACARCRCGTYTFCCVAGQGMAQDCSAVTALAHSSAACWVQPLTDTASHITSSHTDVCFKMCLFYPPCAQSRHPPPVRTP